MAEREKYGLLSMRGVRFGSLLLFFFFLTIPIGVMSSLSFSFYSFLSFSLSFPPQIFHVFPSSPHPLIPPYTHVDAVFFLCIKISSCSPPFSSEIRELRAYERCEAMLL